MAQLESIFWELLLLGFFGLLYYLYQRRKILSPKSPADLISGIEWSSYIYELHSFLEKEQAQASYEELNESALRLEDAYLHKDLSQFSHHLLKIFDCPILSQEIKGKTQELIERL